MDSPLGSARDAVDNDAGVADLAGELFEKDAEFAVGHAGCKLRDKDTAHLALLFCKPAL